MEIRRCCCCCDDQGEPCKRLHCVRDMSKIGSFHLSQLAPGLRILPIVLAKPGVVPGGVPVVVAAT
jgi:hypothetical protein